MKKWLIVGGGLLLLVWAPFLYDELTSSPSEKKGRALPTDDPSQEPAAADENVEVPDKPGEPVAEVAKPDPGAKPAPAVKPATVEPAAQPGAKPEGAEPSAAEGDGPPDDDEQDPPPAPPPSPAGPTAVLKHAFETQPRDTLWAADTEAHIRALFKGGDMPAELLQSTSCRTAVCRIELRWSRERATAFVSLYETVRKDFQGEVGVEPIAPPDEKGGEQVNLYLARKGYTVADLTK